jgi:hypothetical protein
MAVALPSLSTQRFLPWTIPVEYTSAKAGGDVTFTLQNAGRHTLTIEEAEASNGVYQAGDEVFTVDTDEFTTNAVVPKPADKVLLNGDKYTVLRVEGSPFLEFKKLVTRNLVLAFDLRDLINVEVDEGGQSDTGAEAHDWRVKYKAVKAKVQKVDEDEQDFRGKSSTVRRYTIPVETELDVNNSTGDFGRVEWQGKRMTIVAYRQSERVDVLPLIECELRP